MPRLLVKGDPRKIAAPGAETSRTYRSRTGHSRRENLRPSVPQEQFLPHPSILPYF